VGALLETELAGVPNSPMARASLSDLSQRKGKVAPMEPASTGNATIPAPKAVAASGGTAKYVVIALVVLLCAGAAVYFGNIIPR
jgi:hypothetical protein